MKKPIIVIKKHDRDYAGYISLASHVLDAMTDNPNFIAPAPSLAVVRSAVTNVMYAFAKWGSINNRGSHADLVDLRHKTLILAQLLKALSQYAQTTAQLAAGS